MRIDTRNRLHVLALASLAVGGAGLAAAQSTADDRESYSYLRVIEGQATLASAGAGPGEEAQANQPLLTGDRVQVAGGARVEIALADRNLLRAGGNSALTLTRVAFSADRGDRSTQLDLESGEIVLLVGEDALGDQLPEIRTPGGDVVIHRPGTYRIETDGSGWTELVVREGFAELATGRGSTVVRAGESAVVDGARGGRVQVAGAGPEDALERWGAGLSEQAQQARQAVSEVEPELAYSAAPLAESGSWFYVDSVAYWRPNVGYGWAPYTDGRWGWTPSGLTWVSYEPWGWVPYHYGTWCQLPGYGWAWRPGAYYSPAWVYWHWGVDWVGWIPTGYYTGWYGSGWHHPWFRHGYYGWAGGSWSHYNNWCYVPARRVCDRDGRRWHRRGHDLERENRGQAPNGVVTTTTAGVPRRFYDRPGETFVDLRRRGREARGGVETDVTDFVARKRELPPDVVNAVSSGPDDRRGLPRIDRTGERPGATRVARGSDPSGERGSGGGVRPPVARGDEPTAERRGGGGVRPPVARGDEPTAERDTPRAAPRTTGTRPAPRLEPRDGNPDSTPTARRPVEPSDRQGWRGEDGERAGTPRALPTEPGARVRPAPEVPRPRVLTPTARPTEPQADRPATPGGGRPVGEDDRQGWRGRAGGGYGVDTPRSGPALPAQPSARGGEPVRRVVDGVRRYEPVYPDGGRPTATPTWRSGGSAPSQPRAWQPPNPRPGYGTPPSRPTYSPPAGSAGERGRFVPGGPPSGSSSPRVSGPPSGSSSPRVSGQPSGGGGRTGSSASSPPSGSRSSSGGSGSRSSGGGSRSHSGGSSSRRDPPGSR